jgi:hypothetical protein
MGSPATAASSEVAENRTFDEIVVGDSTSL